MWTVASTADRHNRETRGSHTMFQKEINGTPYKHSHKRIMLPTVTQVCGIMRICPTDILGHFVL